MIASAIGLSAPGAGPPLPAEAREHRHENDDQENEPEEQPDRQPAALPLARGGLGRRVLRRLGLLLGSLERLLHLLADRLRAGDDAARHVARLELRHDDVADDLVRQRVGHDRFEAIADLDPHLALVGRDDQDDTVVRVLLPDPPGTAELIAVIGDVIALQVRDRRDDELAAGRLLHFRRKLGELRDLCGREQVGVVDHPAGQLGEGRVGQRARRPGQQGDEQHQETQHTHQRRSGGGTDQLPFPKFTVGATSAPALAWKGVIGLAP
ncbi:hypothetical protein S2M10_27000 [Sphingomonas sp. S2M10]|nr:hypothetical protein [Sphingomonas sp. S2M10]